MTNETMKNEKTVRKISRAEWECHTSAYRKLYPEHYLSHHNKHRRYKKHLSDINTRYYLKPDDLYMDNMGF